MDSTERITFRPLERSDFRTLSTWFLDPEIRRWWREDHSVKALEAKYGPAIDFEDPTELFVIEFDGQPSGMIQRYRSTDDPEWLETLRLAMPALSDIPSAGIDYLLDAEVRRRGIGTRAVDAFSPTVFQAFPEVTAIVVAVQQANRASWRALERAGYKQVWAGSLVSADPSDEGPAYLLIRNRQ